MSRDRSRISWREGGGVNYFLGKIDRIGVDGKVRLINNRSIGTYIVL